MHRCAVVLHLCVSITNCIPKYRVTLLKRTNEKQIEKKWKLIKHYNIELNFVSMNIRGDHL